MFCFIKRFRNPNHICRHCMKPGMVIYKVWSLGGGSFMRKYILTSKPYLEKNVDSYFCKASRPDSIFEHEFSLMDCGIIPNNYNQHRTFLDEYDAAHYLATQRQLPYVREKLDV